MRRWLRLLPLAALTLGLTWSGARASSEAEAAARIDAPEVAAPQLPPVIATGKSATPSPEFAFTNLRRF